MYINCLEAGGTIAQSGEGNMTKIALDYLKQMPHRGAHTDLVDAARVLGFSLRESHDQTLVLVGDVTVAVVQGDELSIQPEAAAAVAKWMPPVTPEQGHNFNRVLSRLERDVIAVHEAGHVVAAHAFGFKVCFARLGEASQEVQVCEDLVLQR